MTWSNLRFNVWRSFVARSTNLPSCFLIKFLKQLLKSLLSLNVFCYHGNKSTILLFYSIFRTTPEVSSKLYFVEKL